MQKIYDEFKNKGLEIVAINQGDAAAQVNAFIHEKKWSFPIVLDDGSASTKYKVSGVPTNILVNAQGQIIYRGEGFDETELRSALRGAGIR